MCVCGGGGGDDGGGGGDGVEWMDWGMLPTVGFSELCCSYVWLHRLILY